MAFDSQNRPYLINNRNPGSYGQIRTRQEDGWKNLSFLDAIETANRPTRRELHARGQLVFDDADALYATVGGWLVYSSDFGASFSAYRCPGSLELRVGQNSLAMPPAIAQRTNIQDTPGVRWGSRSTLSIFLPTKVEGGLELGEPIWITDDCLIAGSDVHSGGTSFAVTTGLLTHLVYTKMPDDPAGGNPTYIATVDRRTRSVVAREFLVNAQPVQPDIHSHPTVAVDSRGYLHVIAGAHGQPFYYLRSLMPASITRGWTNPAEMAADQCYASLICDQGDRLHSVFRQWRPHATLGYQTKAAMSDNWSEVQTLVHGALRRDRWEYGIFFHRLFIDRNSVLYLSFTFYENHTTSKGQYPEALAVSEDGGKSWRLADEHSFTNRLSRGRGGKRRTE